ncbi:SRPBCC family protein [Salinimicrobium sp. TH3]|uniref:SRPBCC family protein n=1 Tax=Salinimicrobium sp. TH3 TaxID=2997342 RepID=UPI0022765AF3|nr:SRPBCC family protein [Salinimicrobium sp. TH3]MCY2687660.1 SRPBCC family protein [Salinimicrobium sp. TH3]
MKTKKITVETLVPLPVEKVWQLWTGTEHIKKWNFATPEWHTPSAENDLKESGKFNYRMEAKDGSQGFDFSGEYQEVEPHRLIRYRMDDGREVSIHFKPVENATFIEETFDPEQENSIQQQRDGWQAILENFRKYAESND